MFLRNVDICRETNPVLQATKTKSQRRFIFDQSVNGLKDAEAMASSETHEQNPSLLQLNRLDATVNVCQPQDAQDQFQCPQQQGHDCQLPPNNNSLTSEPM
jgi:hypothetical protein